MQSAVRDVAAFHRKLGDAGSNGFDLTAATLRRRLGFIDEEWRETHEAMAEAIERAEADGLGTNDPAVAHLVQELIDLAYVIAGTFVELGIDPEPAWAAVHAANMQKVAAPGGGKAVKPRGWQPPVVPVRRLNAGAG